MEKATMTHEAEGYPMLEEEALALAKKVLGEVPPWFWRNEKEIEKNRTELEEWTRNVLEEINQALDRLERILH